RAARERELGIDHDARGIEELPHPEAVAARTGPRRVVEREQPRLELRQAVTADVAGEAVREHELFRVRIVHERDARDAVGQAQRKSVCREGTSTTRGGGTSGKSQRR